MRIDKLIIHGFGKFIEREFTFGSNFSLIIGDNEAGKSTLMKAIMAAFFGLRTSDSSRWKPWSDYQDFALTAEFATSEGQRLRLRRDLATHQAVVEDISSEMSGFYADGISRKKQQDLAGKEPTLLFKGDANPGGRTPEKARYDELLHSWLGLADDELFRHTVYVGQNELVALDKHDIVERLKSLISGPELASYQAVLAALEKRLDGLRRLPGRRRDRKIEELVRELARKREMLQSLEGRVRSLAEQERERERLIEKSDQSEQERVLLNRMVQAMDALEKNAKEAEEIKKVLSERRRDKERIEKILEEIDRLQKELET
ncbi:AAA family ATPase, partial [Candidatus Hakubella thermalkaliphila]